MRMLVWVLLGVACLGGLLQAAEPETANEYVRRGMDRFRRNQIAESLQDFDKAAELRPQEAPHLWQRGISDYYAGEFKKGRAQFESHKAVNPDDVENATWHFICVARIEGIEKARKQLIEINTARDARVPMAEVYAFYAGKGTEEGVLKAAAAEGSEEAKMYAHLYLGLYHEAAGDAEKAKRHMRVAAAARLKDHYMHDVSRVHLLQRKWSL